MICRQEQEKAESRSASTMCGGLSVTLPLGDKMLRWSVDNWMDSREMVSLVCNNWCC